jgi:hypothetical protein
MNDGARINENKKTPPVWLYSSSQERPSNHRRHNTITVTTAAEKKGKEMAETRGQRREIKKPQWTKSSLGII